MSAPPLAAVVVVGSEILRDGRVDANGPFVEAVLGREGIACVLRLVVGDERRGIAEAIRHAAASAEIVVVCGGLGPTFDDLTREGCAEALGRATGRSESLEALLKERYRRRGLTPSEGVFRMADVIEGAEVLRNGVGSAPGQFVPGPPDIFLLPGVPAEMEAMLREEVLPRIRRRAACEPPEGAVLKIAGMYESEVEGRIRALMQGWTGLACTILASPGEVTLILRAEPGRKSDLERAAAGLRQALGDAIYAEIEEGIEKTVGRLLRRRGLTLATAESCTGGMLGALITSVPGSSDYYLGGAVAYANRMKEILCGVSSETLADHGAVSAETASAMAHGARERFEADLALAVTGIAGPGGGTPGRPVGLVHIALASPWGDAARVLDLPGDRAIIRTRACRAALDLLRREMLGAPGGAPT